MSLFVYKYRRRTPDARPTLVEPSTVLEASWIAIPVVLVLIIFNQGFQGFIKLATPPPDAYQINVTARMWLWEFEDPNGGRSRSEEDTSELQRRGYLVCRL